MGNRFVLQPNGLLARFSDMVDDFTDYDLTRQNAVALLIKDNMPPAEAVAKVDRGLADEIPPAFAPSPLPPIGMRRMTEALQCIEIRHGRARRAVIERYLGVKL